MDPKRKFFLFNQAKHFCSVPWTHLKVDMSGNVNTCVVGAEDLGDLNIKSVGEILSSEKIKKIRNNLSQDILDNNCHHCHPYENKANDDDYNFLRGLYNSMFKSEDIDYDKLEDFKLQGVDLHWSSLCDLKCVTCWSKQSSSIAKEEGKEVLHTPNATADKLIDYIIANQGSLREIYLSGGEPTMINHNLRLLKRLRRDLNFKIRINTNMMWEPDNQIIKELLEFPHVLVTMSADAIDQRYNYIRRGADWTKFLKNLTNLLTSHFTWRLNSVFFVGSALYLSDTQDFFVENYGINDFTINQCGMEQYNLQCRNLPSVTKEKTLEKLLKHQARYKHNLNLFGQLNNCIKEINIEGDPSYKNYFDQIDLKAGTNWTEVFPELVYDN